MPASVGDSSTTGSAWHRSAPPESRPRRSRRRCTRAAIRASTTPTCSSVGGGRGRNSSRPSSSLAQKTPSKSSVWKWMFRFNPPPKRWMTVTHPDRPSRIPYRRARWRWKPKQHTHEHAKHRVRQRVITRGGSEDGTADSAPTLAHRHPRQHLVDKTGGALRHAPPAATRAEAPARAGKRHEPLHSAVGASQAREAVRQHPAGQEISELLFHEPRQG